MQVVVLFMVADVKRGAGGGILLRQGRIGYHGRAGSHDVAESDWMQYLNFPDRQWR